MFLYDNHILRKSQSENLTFNLIDRTMCPIPSRMVGRPSWMDKDVCLCIVSEATLVESVMIIDTLNGMSVTLLGRSGTLTQCPGKKSLTSSLTEGAGKNQRYITLRAVIPQVITKIPGATVVQNDHAASVLLRVVVHKMKREPEGGDESFVITGRITHFNGYKAICCQPIRCHINTRTRQGWMCLD